MYFWKVWNKPQVECDDLPFFYFSKISSLKKITGGEGEIKCDICKTFFLKITIFQAVNLLAFKFMKI